MIARVDDVRWLAAGNRFHRRPVAWVALVLDGTMPDDDRVARIDAILHEFADQRRFRAPPGDGSPAGMIADLAVGLLRRALEPVRFRRVLPADAQGRVPVVFACHDDRLARDAVALAIALLRGAHDAAIGDAVRAFVQRVEPRVINSDDIFLVETAEERGIAWRLSASGERDVVLGEGLRSRRALANLTDRTSYLGITTCRSKSLTNLALRRAGLPATRQLRAREARDAVAAAERIGYPVVVKPVTGSKGAGVACNLVAASEVERAFASASAHGGVIVENHLDGDDHRLLVIDGRFVRCTRRMRARVVGDGTRSIEALVAAENARPERRPAPDSRFMPISLDDETDRILRLQGLGRGSVPASGAVVLLRATANWSLGGTAALMTDAVHPDYVHLAEHVARLFGVDIVGVDVITDDISRSFRETGACINEVQTQPAIGAQRRALGPGAARLHETLMDMLLPAEVTHRVPIVAVVGPRAEDVAMRVARRLAADGAGIGVATRGGLVIDGRRVSQEDHRDAGGLARLIDDPTVAAIVVECEPRNVAATGLAHDRIDVVVTTGGTDDGGGLTLLTLLADGGIVSLPDDRAAAAAAATTGRSHRTAAIGVSVDVLDALSVAAFDACATGRLAGESR